MAKAPCNKSRPSKGMWGHASPGKVWISDLLRSFLVQSWDEIARVGEPAAKPSHCPLPIVLEAFTARRIKGVAPLRSLVSCVIIIAIFEPNYRTNKSDTSIGRNCSAILTSTAAIGMEYKYSQPIRSLHCAWRYFFFGWCIKLWSGGRRTCRTYSYGPEMM